MDLHVSGVRSDQLRDDSDFPAHYPLKSTTLKVKIEENSGGMSHAIHKNKCIRFRNRRTGRECKNRLGQIITQIPGKSEEFLMIELEDNCRLYFGGNQDGPTAYVKVEVFGSLSDEYSLYADQGYLRHAGRRAADSPEQSVCEL